MEIKKYKFLRKWLSIFIVYLMIISIFSGTFAVIAPRADRIIYDTIDSNSLMVAKPPANSDEEDYIVELMHPEDPAMRSSWYLNMLEKVQAYNEEMGWGNAGPAWYYNPPAPGSRALPGGGSGVGVFGFTSGLQEVVVIACNFSDSPSNNPPVPEHDPDTHTTGWFNQTVLFNEASNEYTLHNYYNETSYGIVNVTGEIAQNSSNANGWYTSGFTRVGAKNNNLSFVKDAVSLADPDIDYSQFDNNANGKIDHLIIIHAGDDRASSGDPNDIWSHRSWTSGSFGPAGDGKSFNSYVLVAENDPMGVFAHEFGHDLGLPDLYDTDPSGGSIVGKWALMDTGAWNKEGSNSCPAHLTAWGKEQLGWVTPIVISEANNNQGYHQVNETSSTTNDTVCYRVDIPGFQEYWLVENRNQTIGSFEKALPNGGIVIWHCMDKFTLKSNGGIDNSSWNDGPGPNNFPYYGTQIENPKNDNNDPLYTSNKDDAYWSEASGNTAFNPYTSPATLTNNGTVTTIYIDNISDNAKWNMTVRILVKDDETAPSPPTGVNAFDTPNDNGNSINLTWDNSTDDYLGGGDVTHYTIYINDTGEGVNGLKHKIKEIPATGTASYETKISGLIDGVTYHFCIMADDGPNESPCSNNDSATPSDNIALPPQSFNASDTFPDDGENITLTWGLSAHDPFVLPGGDIQGYNIYQLGVGLIDNVAPGTTTYKIGNLTNGASYTFNVSSYDEVNNNASTADQAAIPSDDAVGVPTGMTVNPSTWTVTNSFQINWNDPYDNSGLKTGAWYYIGTSAPTTQNQGTWNSNKPFTITNAPEGRNRIYIWLEDDSGNPGNRDYRNNSFAFLRLDTTAPSNPISLDATPGVWTNANTFSIDWSYPTEPAGDTSGLKLGAWYKIGSAPTSGMDGAWRGIRPFDVSTTEGQTMLYLWLEDNVGNIDHTQYSTVDLFLDLHPPMSPLNLQATPSSWSRVNSFRINWTNPTDDAGIKGVYYKLDAPPFGNNDGVYTQRNDVDNLTDITVSGEGAHPIHVWLLDKANNINYLNHSFTTLYYDITAPTTPTNINVNPNVWTNVNSFDITWTNPSDLSGIKRVWYRFDNPPISDADGNYIDADNISMLSNINVSKEGAIDMYLWLEDYAGNVNYVSYNTATLFYDATPPSTPAVLISNPGTWTKTNSFTITWTNPTDTSGIAGAYYRLVTPPNFNTDGIFSSGLGINEIYNIAVPDNGTYTVYVWLVDRAGNIDFNNHATKELYYDAVPPAPPENLTVTPSGWTNVNSFTIDWLNPYDVSRISSAFYKLGAPPRSDADGFKYNEDNISLISNLQVYDDGSYTIYVWLQDYAGNFNYTQNSSVELLYDVTAPQIVHSKVTSATEGVKVTISAILTDEHTGISASYLYYKNRNDNLYNEIPMSFAGGDIYTAEIPAEDVVSDGLEYYLMVEDAVMNPNVRFFGMYGQTISKPTPTDDIDITVTLEDLSPPSIVHNVVATGTFGVAIKITAIVTDDASGVANATLFYKSMSNSNYKELSMGTNNPYMAEIPSLTVTTAGVEYYIKAVDKSLNVNTAFYGRYGQVSTAPNFTNDIDIMITDEDETAPQITYGPVVSNITATTAVILWITDEPANSKIYIGTTADYNSIFADDVFITYHNFMIFELTPATTYHYQVQSSDPYGNGPAMSSDRIFTTTSAGQVDTDGDGIPDTTDQDDDNDGIPDDWETQYGLDPKNDRDSERDNDGDGYSNRKEYLEGSHPLDRASTPITANDIEPPIIVHTAIITGQAGRAVEITAVVTDNESGVKSVMLYFKPITASSYTQISMGTENPYTAEISGLNVNPDGVEYYIKAEDHAYTPNVAYFGRDGILNYEPDSDSDIDIMVTGTVGDDDEDDGGLLEDIGEPFGITNPTTCILVIILLILVLVAVVIGIWGARRRMAMAREREQFKKDHRLEPKDVEDDDLVIMGDDDIDWDGL